MDHDDNVYAQNIHGKCENRLYNQEQTYLADIVSIYDYAVKSEEEQEETEDTNSYTRSDRVSYTT